MELLDTAKQVIVDAYQQEMVKDKVIDTLALRYQTFPHIVWHILNNPNYNLPTLHARRIVRAHMTILEIERKKKGKK